MSGYNLPPGCSVRDLPGCADEMPCAVCGEHELSCECPECSVCRTIGDEYCYLCHGMVRTKKQIASLAAAEARWEAENAELMKSFPTTCDGDC